MLSTAYRLRLESICQCIANKEQVPLEDMIWAEKLATHTTARDWLNKGFVGTQHRTSKKVAWMIL